MTMPPRMHVQVVGISPAKRGERFSLKAATFAIIWREAAGTLGVALRVKSLVERCVPDLPDVTVRSRHRFID
jgi:hypothetical protein